MPWQEAYHTVFQVAALSIGSLILTAVLAGVMGIFMARRLTVPLVNLTKTATRIAGGEMGLQTAVSGPQEVVSLAMAFNSMTGQLQESIESLEQRVADRTAELGLANEQLRIELAQRERIERERQERLVMLNALIGAMQPGILVEDINRRVFATNDVLRAMLGSSGLVEELVGTDAVALHRAIGNTTSDTDGFASRITAITEALRPVGGEEIQFQGERIFERDYLPVSTSDDRLIAHFWQYRDVTEHKKAEELQQESAERYKLMFESAPLAITITRDASVLYANPSFLELYGFSSLNELKSQPPLEEFAPELRSQIKENIQRRAQGLFVPNSYETVCLRKDGTRFPVQLYLSRVTFSDGTATIGIMVDITERKRNEKEKEKLQSELISAQKMESVGRLAGGVAHDFNNMLGVILGYTEMALEQVDPSLMLHANLEEIHKAAERSAGLTRQLLAFARKQTFEPKVLDLNQIVEGMLTMLRRLIGEDVQLIWKPRVDVWPVKVDPSQIDQILTNLCVNARQAITDVGTITIGTDNSGIDEVGTADRPGAVPGEYVVLKVRDDGCGMNEETLSHLFEPFFTTKDVGKGTGLGLATVYGIVKQNNGFVYVDSEPDKGSTFSIFLSPSVSTLHDRETILVVEDETANLKLIRGILEKWGYTVLEAGSPGEAIRVARNHTGEINLVVTDIIMPEMNGLDLAKSLRSFYPHIKRLFMSGYPADVIAKHGMLEEEMNFIQKPFSLKNLAEKIRQTLERGQAQS
jgi:PAS domain S-box-containing protein